MNVNKVAIYPGTFDPITNGHIDVINRILLIFNQIIIAISTAYGKNTLFDISTREEIIKKIFKKNKKIKVISFKGLLIDIAKKYNAYVIIRGLRTISDFNYEFQMSAMNNKLDSNIQTIFLIANQKYSYISSTLIRDIALHNYKHTYQFVPNYAFDKIKFKYSNKQYI